MSETHTATRRDAAARWPGRWLRLWRLWRERREYRCALARMDAHLLSDIGVDEATVRAEIAKPFWKA